MSEWTYEEYIVDDGKGLPIAYEYSLLDGDTRIGIAFTEARAAAICAAMNAERFTGEELKYMIATFTFTLLADEGFSKEDYARLNKAIAAKARRMIADES